MKHNQRKFGRVIKQLYACSELSVKTKGAKLMIKSQNGEQYLVHVSEKAMHPLRRWLKKNSSIENLKV